MISNGNIEISRRRDDDDETAATAAKVNASKCNADDHTTEHKLNASST